DSTQYVVLQWKASKRDVKHKLGLVTIKTGEWRQTLKKKWRSLTEIPLDIRLVFPVPHLHLCNDPPSGAELELIQGALRNAEVSKSASGLQEIPPQELDIIDNFISELKGVASPLRRLPSELLQSIFLRGSYNMRTYFLRSYHPEAIPSGQQSGATYWPWTLSQVCRRWRNICIATPELWNYLPPLMLKRIYVAGERRRELQLFSLMLERSKNASLHVVIWGLRSTTTKHPTLEMLIRASDRWETAYLKLYWPTYLSFIMPIKTKLQRLRYLAYLFFDSTSRTVPPSWDAFSELPALQYLDLDISLRSYFNHWQQPEPLSHTFTRAVHAFLNNFHLQSLVLDMDLSTRITPSFTLPRLRRCKLIFNYHEVEPIAFATLDAMTLPALEEFVIISYLRRPDILLSTILLLIRRSISATPHVYPLTKLRLLMATVDSHVLIPLVETLPLLTVLEFPLSRNSADFAKRLSSEDPMNIIAPNLEFCHLLLWQTSPYLLLANRLARARWYDNLQQPESIRQAIKNSSDILCAYDRPFKRLKVLTTACQNVYCLRRHQRVLEEWAECHSSSQTLDIPPSTIADLEGLLYGVTIETTPEDTGDAWGFAVDGLLNLASAMCILEELKKCRLEDVDIRDIYIPQVHRRLQAVEKWIASNATKFKWKSASSVLGELQKTIQATLREWYFALDEQTPRIHWAAICSTVLVYIPPDDPIRSSSDSINLARVYDASTPLSPFYELYSESVSSDH
ncbi:hypothetical protein CVT24_002955, partial [Panaeolus cyanescens]